MKITKQRLEEIRATFRSEDDHLTLVEAGKKKYPCWDVWGGQILWFPENSDHFTEVRPDSTFMTETFPQREFDALIFRGWKNGEETYDRYTTWEELAKELGVTDMVVVSTKLPAIIASRLTRFANAKGESVSSQLRLLAYDYVEQEFKDNAGELIFKEV